MDLYALEVFVITASKPNFSKAAKSMSVTQSTLSQQIRRLETELGYPLFLRKKGQRTIELTPQGKEFLTLATKIHGLWQEALEIGHRTEADKLTVSVMDSVMSYTIPHLMQRFIDEHPDVQLQICNYYSRDALAHLTNGTIDLAIIRDFLPTPGIALSPLFSDPWVILCGKNIYRFPLTIHPHQLPANQQLYLLGSDSLEWNKRWFPSGETPAVSSHTLSFLNRDTFDDGKWSLLPYTIARHLERSFDVELHYLTDPPPHRMIYLALRQNHHNEAIEPFLDCVRSELRNISGITRMF